jgi:hypothetical protein
MRVDEGPIKTEMVEAELLLHLLMSLVAMTMLISAG